MPLSALIGFPEETPKLLDSASDTLALFSEDSPSYSVKKPRIRSWGEGMKIMIKGRET